MIEGFYWFEMDGRILSIEDEGWTLAGWREAAVKGPGLRPTGKNIIVLRDAEPETFDQTSILIPNGRMETVTRGALVISVPLQYVNGQWRSGVWAPRRKEGTVGADEYDRRAAKEVFHEFFVMPGDRVLIPFFGGDHVARPTPRLRAIDGTSVIGFL